MKRNRPSKARATLRFVLLLLTLVSVDAHCQTGSKPARRTPSERSIAFSSDAYEHEALRLLVKEANQVAQQLSLSEHLPITESNLLEHYIMPPRMARGMKAIGNITTSNYTYCVTTGNCFSGLIKNKLSGAIKELQHEYIWPTNHLNTNVAAQTAKAILSTVGVDVAALEQNCNMRINAVHPTGFKSPTFVPIYTVYWVPKNLEAEGSSASIQFCLPNRLILQLYVLDAQYIKRKRVEISNADELIKQK